MIVFSKKSMGVFQSTLPAGEATKDNDYDVVREEISIHASRGGSDFFKIEKYSKNSHFNPRFPRGKRQMSQQERDYIKRISIHASRGGSDKNLFHNAYLLKISIHASRGGSDSSLLFT